MYIWSGSSMLYLLYYPQVNLSSVNSHQGIFPLVIAFDKSSTFISPLQQYYAALQVTNLSTKLLLIIIKSGHLYSE